MTLAKIWEYRNALKILKNKSTGKRLLVMPGVDGRKILEGILKK